MAYLLSLLSKLLMSHLKIDNDTDTQRQVTSLYCAANKLRPILSLQLKTLFCACCMPANCGVNASTHCVVQGSATFP